MNILEKIKVAQVANAVLNRVQGAWKMKHGKAALMALGTAVGGAIIISLRAQCPGLLDHWPSLLWMAVMAGFSTYLKSDGIGS